MNNKLSLIDLRKFNHTSMMIVYKTKASSLIKLLFTIVLLLLLLISALEKSLALFVFTITIGTLVMYIFYTTHYIIYENMLTIKSGFIYGESIEIDSIKKVTRKRKNLLSGPGFSTDRLIIEYKDHECVVISPFEKEIFLNHLKRINPDITIIQ